jgi:2-keto-4-pentenoate hydratase/2-oxohepta-3-ene-1,7-dioic acid hydratase in catechol pathway
MKLATFSNAQGASAIGVVDTERGAILDLAAAARASGGEEPAFRDMLALIDAGPSGLDKARALAAKWPQSASRPLAGAKLLSPLPEPRQMRDCLVFEEHLRNARSQAAKRMGREPPPIPQVWYEQPIYYKCNRFSVVGHEHEVTWPAYSNYMDYECEMACVIGKTGKDIKPEHALDHIFGFTIFNDFSARDAQQKEMEGRLGPAKGKDFDTGNVLGPWIVTRDEIGDGDNLKMEVRVNGERWGGGNSSAMHHKFSAILAFISQSETLHAGEVIGSGTVGTGAALELGRQLKSGDVVELEIEKIGVLRNRVVHPNAK